MFHAALPLVAIAALGSHSAYHQPWTQAAAVKHARTAATAYWHGNPPCGAPEINVVRLPTDYAGLTYWDECRIEVGRSYVQNSTRDPLVYLTLAAIVTHEYGHLTLGLDAFTRENPKDPIHNPRRNSIMRADISELVTRQGLATAPSYMRNQRVRVWMQRGACFAQVGSLTVGTPCRLANPKGR